MAIERRDDQAGEYVVAGNLYLPTRQDLEYFQKDQLGPELNPDQIRNLTRGEIARGFVERGESKIAQDHTLMPGTAFLTVGIDANLKRVHADLARDIHDIVWMKLSRKEFVPRFEVAGRY
jgi:hypothetical protein